MFVAFWMLQRLTREINDIQKQIMDKQIELSHYTKYAGQLGGTTNLSINNIAGLSSDLVPRASVFAQYSDQASSMSAMQNLQMMKMMGRVPVTGNPMIDMQIQMSAYNQFKQEALKALKQQEVNAMNEKEKAVQLELNALQAQLQVKKSQIESYKQLVSDSAKAAAPNFG